MAMIIVAFPSGKRITSHDIHLVSCARGWGIENLLDHVYRDHLAGYNRNGFGDVAIGTRVPGAGRGAFIRLSLKG